jgi:nucleotide-binding universal stress UspA family protein
VFNRHDRAVKTREKEAVSFKSILVPVNGTESSLNAVEFACNLAKRSRARVHVVHVIEVKRSLPLDAELVGEAQAGESILAEAEAIARRLDFEVQGDLLQARDAGHAIVDEAVERQADVIVVGVPFRRPFGEFELGKVASHVLKSAHCEVILLRMPFD